MSASQHDRVAEALALMHSDLGVAESHGVLCGMLCGPRPFEVQRWLEYLAGAEPGAPPVAGTARSELDQLRDATRAALVGGDYDFALMLPHDDEPLAVRAAAFAAWCRGFLSGIGLGGIVELSALGEDARGFVTDLDRFCRIAFDVAGGEDDEQAFAELTEFTRMGVLLLHAEVAAASGDGADDPTVLH